MTPDTDLEEVARHLTPEAADYLGNCPEKIQTAVLKHVRTMVVFWEGRNYVFDPVLYEGLLTALVPSIAGIYGHLFRAIDDKAELTSKLALAETMVTSLSEMLANHVCEEKSS